MDPFNPSGVEWKRVSPRLTYVRLVGQLIGYGIVLVGLCVTAWFVPTRWAWLGPGLWAILALSQLALTPRRVRAWGYTEREDDLLIKHGLFFRSMVVVPYGRMQYVDVNAGPIDRAIGLASVQLHTASASTDAMIPGLPNAEAARLRDRLAARGEAKLAGL